MTTELTIDERNQRSFDTFRKILALEDENGNPRFPLADKERQDDYFVRGCPSGSGDYYLYWHLSDISCILAGVCLISFAFTAIFGDWQQDKHSGDYTITRKGAYLYVNSHTEYLESAELEIAKQDKNFVYAKYKDKIYKIPQIQDKFNR